MSEAEIAAKHPAILDLEAGEYHWCACGRSKNQPFCDGSHAGSEFTPERVVLTEATRVALCQCKRSANGPHCDGSHKGL